MSSGLPEPVAMQQLLGLHGNGSGEAYGPDAVALLQRAIQHTLSSDVPGLTSPQRLTEILDETKADLLVIGRAAKGLGRLRSNAYALIRESPCPVISV